MNINKLLLKNHQTIDKIYITYIGFIHACDEVYLTAEYGSLLIYSKSGELNLDINYISKRINVSLEKSSIRRQPFILILYIDGNSIMYPVENISFS